jgi:hypothetical protein
MDELVYDSLNHYFTALGSLGYYKQKDVEKLLVLTFIRNFAFNDFRGAITKEDYHELERALYCLFGTNCLIPYPDYSKMGKLNLGSVSELAQRVKEMENTKVVKGKQLITNVPDINVDNLTGEQMS